MLRSGFGSKSSKSLSSTQGGTSTSSDRSGGPDKVIRSLGASDIKGWYDATDPRLSSTANDADLTFWYDKGPDQTHLHQGTADNKPHYIHSGLNGRPVVRGDGSNDIYLTADSEGTAKNVDWGASCSAYVLVKTADDDNNHGIFGGDSDGTVPKARFGCGSKQDENPDELRIEVFGRVPDAGSEANFNMDNYYDMTGSTGMSTCRNQFALYYLEFQINGGQAGEAAFTRTAYGKNADTAIPVQRTGETNASKVDASEATTMSSKGFDTDQMQVFRNIHDSMDELDGDLAFLLFSNRHYSLKERQKISKAIQQIYGYSGIN
jgi:hypothetical protein